jgi:polyribonucleotide nucleotidyltransferase
MTIRTFLICTALAFAPACSSKSSDPMDKMLTMMDDMGDAIESANGDCGKMADNMESVVKKYESDLKDMKAAAEKMKGDKDKAKELMEKYGDRMKKVMPKMMGAMKCASDPRMKALNEKFEGIMM